MSGDATAWYHRPRIGQLETVEAETLEQATAALLRRDGDQVHWIELLPGLPGKPRQWIAVRSQINLDYEPQLSLAL